MRRNWIKLYVDQCLRGTMVSELSAPERWIWVGLLLMAGDSNIDGKIFLRKDEDKNPIGYSDSTISELLAVDVKTFRVTMKKLIKYEKISVNKHKVITIINWKKYQSEYERQKVYREGYKENSNFECNQSNALDIDRDKDRELDNNIYPPNFEDFWNPYPRKIEKKNAFITWKQLNAKQKHEVAVASENYAIEMKREGRELTKIKHPKSFLNKDKELWKDYLGFNRPYQVGENVQESKPSEDSYWKDRVIKSAEINKELADEFKKARHAKDADRLEELENIGKEKIAEWSKQRQKKIQAI